MIKIITVRDLIIKLLDCDTDSYIAVRDKDGKELHNVEIVESKIKSRKLGCLFG